MARALVIAAAGLLSGCALFAPSYDAELSAKTDAAFDGVAKLGASVELGAYGSPASYPGATDLYASVLANLAVADLRAKTLRVASGGTATSARQQLATLIEGCAERVKSMASLHQRFGLKPDSTAVGPVKVSCDEAAHAAAAMK